MDKFSTSFFYQKLGETHDPAQFFKKPTEKVTVRKSKSGRLDFQPEDGGICELLSFDSPFVAVNPKKREAYAKLKHNSTAWAQHWRHGDKPRPTICMIHGFMADPYWFNSRWLALPWFYQQGYDILLYTLPFHGRRKASTEPFGGYGYFAHGILHINEAVAQSVYDFRLFMDYLESTGVEKIGVTGISLGGYTSALLAAVEDRLQFSMPNVLFSKWHSARSTVLARSCISKISRQFG